MSDFVSRSKWGARPAKVAPTSLRDPQGVALHWEGVKVGVKDHSTCDDQVRQIQNYHMDHNDWNDIAYNMLVCQHGTIYEGRGVGIRSAANGTNASNASYYAVCFIMGPGDDFNNAMKQGGVGAIERLDPDGAVVPHRKFISTQCPGDPVVSWIKEGHPSDGGSPTPQPSPTPPSNDWFEETISMLATLDFTNPSSLKGSGLVDNVQGLLNGVQNASCYCTIDNQAGPQTLKAVQAFQRIKGLKDDGIVGPVTWRALITH